MKIKFIRNAAVGVGLAATLFFYFQYKKTPVFQDINFEPSATGSDNDPIERYNYELMRLRDPATGKIPDHIRDQELEFAKTLPTDANSFAYKISAATTWNPRGPYNLGGRTRALAIDVTDENIILAGTPSGGVWRSADGGTSWTSTVDPGQLQNITCIAQDPRPGKTKIWYAGSGEGVGNSATAAWANFLGNGLFKSTDGGLSWNPLASTTSNTPHIYDKYFDIVWNVAVNPADTVKDMVFAAASGTIYKSIDAGATWTITKGGNTTGGVSFYTDVQITSKGVIYAILDYRGPDKGIWRSTDGVTFTNITPANFPSTYGRFVIGAAPSDENQVYFLGNTPGFGQVDTGYGGVIDGNSLWKYTYVSGNGSGSGGIWEDRSANLPKIQRPFNTFASQTGYDLVVRPKPDDANMVYIGGTDLFRSSDGFATKNNTTYIGGYKMGANFPKVDSYLNHHPDQHSIVFYKSNPNIMLNGNDGGIFKTIDNLAGTVVWTPLNNGYTTSMFYTCAIDQSTPGSDVMVGGAQDNGTWFTNSGSYTYPWVSTRGGDGAYCAVSSGGADYYFSSQGARITKAKLDANGNVLSFARIDPIGGKGYQFVNPFVLDPNNNSIMYLAGGKRLWRNDNLNGIPMVNNWDSISTNWTMFPDTVPTALSKITCLAVSTVPANRLYYGTDKRKVYRIDNANTGTPSAVEITSLFGASGFPTTGYVNCIAVDPRDGNKIMVVFSNYSVYSLFYSADGGTTWSKAAGNLEANAGGNGAGPSCRWASIMPVGNSTVYFVATSTGVYSTDTLMGTNTVWVQQGASSIGNLVCDMIDTRTSDGRVVIATHGHGMYSGTVDQPAVSFVKDPMPGSGFQMRNFPNPASDQTTIEFVLPRRAVVDMMLYDAQGKEIKKIATGEFAEGVHTIPVSTSGLPAGVYYYSLSSGLERAVRKLVRLD